MVVTGMWFLGCGYHVNTGCNTLYTDLTVLTGLDGDEGLLLALQCRRLSVMSQYTLASATVGVGAPLPNHAHFDKIGARCPSGTVLSGGNFQRGGAASGTVNWTQSVADFSVGPSDATEGLFFIPHCRPVRALAITSVTLAYTNTAFSILLQEQGVTFSGDSRTVIAASLVGGSNPAALLLGNMVTTVASGIAAMTLRVSEATDNVQLQISCPDQGPVTSNLVMSLDATYYSGTGNWTDSRDAVLVGSYTVGVDGPNAGLMPPAYSCVEGCALHFGGGFTYGCGISSVYMDHSAYTRCDGGGATCTISTDTYKVGPNYSGGCSAYISDVACSTARVNYCFKLGQRQFYAFVPPQFNAYYNKSMMAWRFGATTGDAMIVPGLDIGPSNYPQITLEAWVWPVTIPNERGFLMSQDAGNWERGIVMHDTRFAPLGAELTGSVVWNEMGYVAAAPAAGGYYLSRLKVQPLMWNHILVTYNQGAPANIYLNGVLYSTPFSVTSGAGLSDLWIGTLPAQSEWTNQKTDMYLRVVRVYDRVLSTAEVLQNYRSGPPESPGTTVPSTCVSWTSSVFSVSCPVGFYGTNCSLACTPITGCATGSLTCTTVANSVCASCNAGYYLASPTSCMTCAVIPNCLVTESCSNSTNQICPSCPTGYFGSGTPNCTLCNLPSYCRDPALNCTSLNDMVCVACLPGFVWTGTLCRDVTTPSITCPSSLTFNTDASRANASLSIAAGASDNYVTANITNDRTVSTNGVVASTFPVGSTVVTYTATDYFGAMASCSITVTVADREPPTIACPTNLAVTTAPSSAVHTMTVPSASAWDNVGVVSVVNTGPAAGTSYAYPHGLTTHVFTARDAANNTAVCEYIVSVTVNCGNITAPAFGVAGPCIVTTVDATCAVACNTYYSLFGSATRTCLPSGAWSGANPTCNDTTSPFVVTVAPAAGATSIPLTGASVVLTFSEPMTTTSLTGATSLACTAAGVSGAISLTTPVWSAGNTVLTYSMGSALPDGASCTVAVTAAAKDAAGVALSPAFQAVFFALDTIAPKVLLTAPTSQQTGVSTATTIVITFDEPMQTAATAGAASLTRTLPSVLVSSLTAVWSSGNKVLTLTPTAPLSNTASYTLLVTVLAVDVAGNALAAPLNVSFATVDLTQPSVSSVTYATTNTRQPLTTFVTVTFTKTMLQVTAQSAFALAPTSGPNTGVAVGGSFLFNAALSVMTFTPYAALASNTNYGITISAAAKDSSGNVLAGAPYTTAFLTVDITPPRVLSTAPAAGATGVALTSSFTIVFDKTMDMPASTAAFALYACPGGVCSTSAVAGTIAWPVPGTQLRFTPSASLLDATQYRMSVSTAARDSFANALAVAFAVFVTTVDVTPPTVISFSPTPGATGVSTTLTDFTITFSKAMTVGVSPLPVTLSDGISSPITLGLQPGAWAAGNAALTVSLYQPLQGLTWYTITVLATAIDAVGHPLSGAPVTSTFRTINSIRPTVSTVSPANLATDVPVTTPIVITFSAQMTRGATQAAVSVSPSVGSLTYSWDAASMVLTISHAALTSDTLFTVTVSTGATDGTPLTMAAPFVWSFRSKETTPPVVVSFSPAASAVGIALGATITATFNVAMDATVAVAQAAVSISGISTGSIAFSWTSSTVLTFTAPLGALTFYTVTLSTATRSAAGNLMSAPFTSSFQTLDPAAPAITSTFPTDGAMNLSVTTTGLYLRFSLPMVPASVIGAFTLTAAVPGQAFAAVPATVTMAPAGGQLDIAPTSAFANYATVLMTTGTAAVSQTSAKNLQNTEVISFRTIRGTPRIDAVVPPDVAEGGPVVLLGAQLYAATCADFDVVVTGYSPLHMTGTASVSVDGTTVSGCSLPVGGYVAGSQGFPNCTLDGLASTPGPLLNLTVVPSLGSVVPARGASGTPVTLTGTALFAATCASVTANGLPFTGTATVTNAGRTLTGCAVPVLSTGTVADLRVTVGVSTSSAGALNYTYSPVVTDVTPPFGFDTDIIAVGGAGFTATPAATCANVFVNGVACTDAAGNVVTDTLLSACLVPFGVYSDPTTAVVQVLVAGQWSAVSNVTVFAYRPFVLAVVSPIAAPANTPFVVRARHVPGIQCRNILFDGAPAVVGTTLSTTVAIAPHTVDISGCLTPNLAIGTVAVVTIAVGGQTSNTNVTFTFRPIVNAISPTAGVIGAPVTVMGVGFNVNPIDVYIGGVLACAGALHDAPGLSVFCAAPVNPYGLVANVTAAVRGVFNVPTGTPTTFAYTPHLTGVSPALGPELSALTISGVGFASPMGAAVVRVDGVTCASPNVTLVGPASERIEACAAPTGTYVPGTQVDVTVTVNGLVSNIVKFTYAPRLDASTPLSGEGGITVHVTGRGFVAGATTVSFVSAPGADNPQSRVVVPTTVLFGSLDFVVPLGLTLGETYRISVTVSGFVAANTAATFFYLGTPFLLPSNPTSPSSAYTTGGQRIYLFALPPQLFIRSSTLAVRFGPASGYNVVVPAANITLLSTSIISLSTPPFTVSGPTPVTASNDGVTFSNESTLFTFYAEPYRLMLVTQPPAMYLTNGQPFTADQQPVLHVVDIYNTLVATANGIFVDAMISSAVGVRDTPSTRTGNVVIGGSTQAEVFNGVAQFNSLSFTGVHGYAYNFTFSALGLLAANSDAVLVVPCDDLRQASVRDNDNGYLCVCKEGYTQTTGLSCFPCGSASFKTNIGDHPCTSCPSNQITGLDNATSLSQCYCQDGYFIPTGQTDCAPCLESGICSHGEIVPKPGYWRAPNPINAEAIYACDDSSPCPGMKNGACADGYKGPLCGVCAEGLARFNKACAVCSPMAEGVIAMLLIILLILIVVIYLIRSALRTYLSPDATSSDMIKILVNYLQVLAFLGDFQQIWPDTLSRMFSISQTSNISTNIFSIQCVLNLDFYQNLLFDFLVPVGIIVVPAVIIGIGYAISACRCLPCKACRRDGEQRTSFVTVYRVSVLVLIFFTHPSLTNTALAALNCREINGVRYVSSDLSVECDGPKYSRWAQAALCFLCLYCIGVILAGVLILFRVRKQLDAEWVKRSYSFLFHGFMPARFFWEMVILLRKTLLIVIKVMLDTRALAQVYCGLWVFAVAIVAHVKLKPFMTRTLMRLETVSLCATFITLLLSLVYIVPTLAAKDARAVLGITVVLMFLTICVVIFMLFHILRALFSEKRDKIPMCIRRRCGCVDKQEDAQGQLSSGTTSRSSGPGGSTHRSGGSSYYAGAPSGSQSPAQASQVSALDPAGYTAKGSLASKSDRPAFRLFRESSRSSTDVSSWPSVSASLSLNGSTSLRSASRRMTRSTASIDTVELQTEDVTKTAGSTADEATASDATATATAAASDGSASL